MNRLTSPTKNSDYLLITLSMLFILCVSIFFLMGKSIRLDEAQSVWQTNHSFIGTLRVIATDVHVPIYFILLRTWIMLFGSTVAVLRSLSLISLLLSIPALYILSKEAYSNRVALLTVFLASVSPFLHWYGSEARMYTLLFLITTLNHLFFLRLFNKNDAHKHTWLFYTLTALVGAYTHVFFGLILLVQIIFYFRHKNLFPLQSFKKFGYVAALVLLEIGGWFIFRLNTGTANSVPLLQSPTASDIFNLISNTFIGLQSNFLNSFFLSLWPLFVILGFTLLARREKISPETAYLLQSTFIPILIAFVASVLIRPLFVSRYLIIVVPSLYLLTAYLISLYTPKVGNRIIGLILLAMVFSLGVEVFSPHVPVNENYREASEYVETHAKSNDIFITSAPFTTYPIEYYYHGPAPLDTFPHWARFEDAKNIPPYSEENLAKESKVWASKYEYLYLLESYDQGYAEKTRLYMDSHYERVSNKEFSPNMNLYVYKLKYL